MTSAVRRRRFRHAAVANTAIGLLAIAGPQASAAPVAPASQPAQPTSGSGSNGPCVATTYILDNPRAPGMLVHVFEPTGAAAVTAGGGRCNDPQRPAVFIAHGLNQTDPTSYQALVAHLVSVGNVVVYPTYSVDDGEKSTLEEAYRVVDAGIVEAVSRTPRIDTTKVGWWGHSMGGSMIPYLVRQGACAPSGADCPGDVPVEGRGWGSEGTWMTNVAMTFALLVGGDDIGIPDRTQVLTIAFQYDQLADNRIGNEVFDALTSENKRHATVKSDAYGQPPIVADHGAPQGGNGISVDALDFLVFRYADLLEACALTGPPCNDDYSATGAWSDGTPVAPALVKHQHPVDIGPYPAALAECDGVYGQQLNQERIHRCGETRLPEPSGPVSLLACALVLLAIAARRGGS